MTSRIQPIYQINQRARDVLIRELGVVDANRFLGQFRAGVGDYTAEREHLFQGMTARDIIAEIKAQRSNDA